MTMQNGSKVELRFQIKQLIRRVKTLEGSLQHLEKSYQQVEKQRLDEAGACIDALLKEGAANKLLHREKAKNKKLMEVINTLSGLEK